MFQGIKKAFNTPELKKKILYTTFLVIVVRIGSYIPVPGIDGNLAVNYFKYMTKGGQNLLQMLDIFSGGAFGQMTIVALSVMPYITASIVIPLLNVLIPSLQREAKENPEASRRKTSKWTRLLATALSIFQATIFARYALQMNQSMPGIVVYEMFKVQAFGIPWLFYLIVIFAMTTGTLFLMWIGEQISEKGIGNGISIIIAVGIISHIPSAIGLIVKKLNLQSQAPGDMSITSLALLCVVFVAVIMGTILIIQGLRKIPVQYARRISSSSNQTQTEASHIPLKINYAGVVPVIFASALLMLPATIFQMLGTTSSSRWLSTLASNLAPGSLVYSSIYVTLILFFTFFWTSTQFHPDQIASDMKRNGAFIPGIRQGKPTEDYLERTMNRITLVGAIFLALIAVLPTIISKILNVDMVISHFFGGTSLLILVGVILDTIEKVDSQLLMNKYDGLLKRNRLKLR